METIGDYVHEWGGKQAYPCRTTIDDETFRDGSQASYVLQPTLEEKQTALHIMDEIGIEHADIGFPRNGETELADVVGLVRYKQRNGLKIQLSCAGRTLEEDVQSIIQASEAGGEALRADLFIGSSEIRKLAEDWDLVNQMIPNVRKSVTLAVKAGLPVMFVTEDTTRAHPETLRILYSEAINCGATRICVADTVGYATPHKTAALLEFTKKEIIKGQDIKVDWHGHRDQGLALANAIAALTAGVDCIHATAGGVGERAGNLEMHLLLNYLVRENINNYNLNLLTEYSQFMSKITGVSIPVNEPLVGEGSLETASGVHAAAILNAQKHGRPDLAGIVYFPFDPTTIGRRMDIKISRKSGRANAVLVLKEMFNDGTEDEVQALLAAAQTSNHSLSDQEIRSIARRAKKS